MARFTHTHLLGLVLRLVMVAVCVLPFASPRQVANAFGFPPPVFAQSPTTPVGEEEENERTEDAKGRVGHQVQYRPAPPKLLDRLPQLPPTASRAASVRECPSPLDPFRNGLGSPYRC
jgi:hypothetical protein